MLVPSATAPPGDGPRWLWFFGLVLGLLLAVRLSALAVNGTDLFFDEAQYWAWSEAPAFGYYSKPPLIAWIIRVATDVCGMDESCIRLPAPLFHAATAVAVCALGARLYDLRTGVLAGLGFALLPGVSFSAGLISTDVPLLTAWAVALWSLVVLIETRETRRWWPALVLGVALGLGLNAKYAMAYFGVCLGVYLVATPEQRWLLRDTRLYAALGIAALLIAPNLLWNATHGFATFQHTADNAKWEGIPFNPLKALEFFAAQAVVFGPILFVALMVVAWRARKTKMPEADRLLLAFALPVLAIVTAQALASRAHANWAAVSYVAGSVLVTAVLLRDFGGRWLRASFGLHAAILGLLIVGTTLAGRVAPPFGLPDPAARALGWREIAVATRGILVEARAAGRPFAAVITDQRSVAAELLYYMRGEPTPVLAWRDGPPQDHFELTRPFTDQSGEPVLFVALKPPAPDLTSAFKEVREIATRALPAGPGTQRTVTFHALSGYRTP